MRLRRVSCLGGGVQPKHRGSDVRQVSPGEYYNVVRRAHLPPSQASMASSERVRTHAPVVRGLMLCACLRALWQCPGAVCGKLQLRQLAAPGDRKDAGPWAPLTTSQASLPSESLPHSLSLRALMLPDGIPIAASHLLLSLQPPKMPWFSNAHNMQDGCMISTDEGMQRACAISNTSHESCCCECRRQEAGRCP